MGVWGQRVYENSVLSAYFFYESKTVLKKKNDVYLEGKIKKRCWFLPKPQRPKTQRLWKCYRLKVAKETWQLTVTPDTGLEPELGGKHTAERAYVMQERLLHNLQVYTSRPSAWQPQALSYTIPTAQMHMTGRWRWVTLEIKAIALHRRT